MAYKNPQDAIENNKKWYAQNKAHANEMSRQWYLKNRVRIADKYKTDDTYRIAKQSKKRATTRSNRIDVLSHYGNKCACCGESQYEFLAIDHIAGKGFQHRKDIGRKGGETFYIWLRRQGYPSGFRVLCHNCNMSRGLYGKCPHESDVSAFMRRGLMRAV